MPQPARCLLPIALVALLVACEGRAPSEIGAHDASAPGGADEDWYATVLERIQAEAVAIRPQDGAFAASMLPLGVETRFDADGVQLSDESGEVLALRTRAWGRSGAMEPLGPRTPELGACTAEVGAAGQCIARLEYPDPVLTEWWVGLGDGLEQGWTLETAPAGEGVLRLEVAVDGALDIGGGGDAAWIIDGQGRIWTVGRLSAWDARGEPLKAQLSAFEGGFFIEVDDTDAVYPLDIDPLYSTAATTLTGTAATGSYATALSGAGDVNNDGYDDVIVGARGTYGNRGRALIYHGSATGVSTTATTSITGAAVGDLLGYSVSSAGDVNNDGYDDVIVGAIGYSSSTGRAYVHHGSASGVSTTAASTLTGEAASNYFGYSVSDAGDVNNDGYDDVIVGANAYSTFTGRAYVYHGSASGVSTTATTTLTGSANYDGFGESVSSAGRLNGDGYFDIIVGAPGYGTYTGRAYTFHGSSTGINSTVRTTLTGPSTNAYFGTSVSSAGDVNTDGYADVIVGAYGASSGAGRAYVYHGGAAGASSTATTTISGSSGTYLGYSVSDAGDVNNDNYDDVIVGAFGYSSSTGRAYVYHGASTGVSTSATSTLTGEATSNYFGVVVSGAGDVNGDGYSDVFSGAYGYSSSTGRAYVHHGSSTGVSSTASSTPTGGLASYFGAEVSDAGDVNNDGYDDVLVGAYQYGSYTGRAYVYQGSASGLSSTATTTLTGEASNNYFGWSLSAAGDVNNDNYDDIIVGAYGYNSSAGRAYVYHGSASGVSTTASRTISGASSANLGHGVSGAGDVNNDGYDDVIVGAPRDNAAVGRAYVHHGSSSGVSASAASTLNGPISGSYFGSVVSRAGDVNNDNYDDVIVGAYATSSSTGSAYIFRGASTGISSTAATTLTGLNTNDSFAYRLSDAGDVNGDGFDDVVVSSPWYSGQTGAVYVFHGGTTMSSTAATVLTGEATSNYFGDEVSGAGDINADGYDDVIVGAYSYSSRTGRAYLFLGGSTGLATTAVNTFTGSATNDNLGAAVSGAGDVNGDGYGDVVIGSYGFEGASGIVHVYHGYEDVDGDGVLSLVDCDDTDVAVGAASLSRFVDADGDGYGGTTTATVCAGATGYSTVSTDCNDGNASISPAGTEVVADGVDQDCDGVDSCYTDADNDNYGTTVVVDGSSLSCASGSGAPVSTDCDDGNASINPGATEVCDAANTDEDCDTLADNNDSSAASSGKTTYYLDSDGDTYGSTSGALFCDLPAGYATNNTDCNDSQSAIHPGATEVCDAANTDEDCDNLADNNDSSAASAGKTTYYLDSDGDSYGSTSGALFCDLPAGYATHATDCDDTASAVHPGAAEVCDAANTDEDCDSLADDADSSATGQSAFYRDADSDGYGSSSATSACDRPSGYAAVSNDCDDGNASINPGAAEICDAANTDEDCDGLADNDDSSAATSGMSTFYPDTDDDGFGAGSAASFCDEPALFAVRSDDCDDADAAINPDASEITGDGVDQDCDGAETCYLDGDDDGYRPDAVSVRASADPDCDDAGEALAGEPLDDCDDADPASHPGATELVGDERDSDCDGDELCGVDADNDGYTANTTDVVLSADLSCDGAGEATATDPTGDCDDGDEAFYPGAPETDCADPADYNCDGSSGYADLDGDGFAACEECNDASELVNPDADEVCNGVDDDCDGGIDVNAIDALVWYADADGDGYTDAEDSVRACEAPDGYTAATDPVDCDDGDAGVSPDGTEIPGDGVDQDCDGVDADGGDDTSAPDDTGTPGDKDCACSSGTAPGGFAWLLALGLLRRRRGPTPKRMSRVPTPGR